MLSLSAALKSGKLQEFIVQEEARGAGPAELAKLDAALVEVIRSPQSGDRTSRSASRDGSTGKRTLQGKKPYASR